MLFITGKKLIYMNGLLMLSLACGAITGSSNAAKPQEPVIIIEPTSTPLPEPPPTQEEESGGISSSQPGEERFYTQDFDEPLKNWSYILTSGDERDFEIDVKDGYLIFDQVGQNIWEYTLYDEFVYTDVRIDLRVENLASRDHEVNILCRYSETEGWWELNVSNGGLYKVRYGKWDDRKRIANYTKVADGASNFFNPGTAVNDIGFECTDQELVVYINGRETRRTKDTNHFLLKGQIGVGVSSFFEPDVHVKFDWIKISEP